MNHFLDMLLFDQITYESLFLYFSSWGKWKLKPRDRKKNVVSQENPVIFLAENSIEVASLTRCARQATHIEWWRRRRTRTIADEEANDYGFTSLTGLSSPDSAWCRYLRFKFCLQRWNCLVVKTMKQTFVFMKIRYCRERNVHGEMSNFRSFKVWKISIFQTEM